jgi:hypothetical protein
MIGGSVASSAYGLGRSTNDVDIVIAPTATQLDHFLLKASSYYVSRPAAVEAFQNRSMFNVIDAESGHKADLILLKERPYSRTEIRRKKRVPFAGDHIFVASPEDVILSKLEWSKLGESERQFQDAAKVAATTWPVLDFGYLEKWAIELSVLDSLHEVLRQAHELNPEP